MQAAGEAMGMTESPLENVQAEEKVSNIYGQVRKALWVKLARGHKKGVMRIKGEFQEEGNGQQ